MAVYDQIVSPQKKRGATETQHLKVLDYLDKQGELPTLD